jgi:hypothetical protein
MANSIDPFHLPQGGDLAFKSVRQLYNEEEQQRRETLDLEQAAAPLEGLVVYAQKRWGEARDAKRPVADEMRDALRRRQGKYDSAKLMEIQRSGGSTIWMSITGVKCRAAYAWLRDALAGQGQDKPWSVAPTPLPTLNDEAVAAAQQGALQGIQELMATTGLMPPPEDEEKIMNSARDAALKIVREDARKEAADTERRMEDVLQEGGFPGALDMVLDDVVTFKNAFIRGPVVRRKTTLKWVRSPAGGWMADVAEELVSEFERVSPFDIYPAPYAEDLQTGYVFQHHRLSRQALSEMIGVPGYSEGAIRECLRRFDEEGLSNWTGLGTGGEDGVGPAAASDESHHALTTGLIDVLELWDAIPGRLLIEWGMTPEQVPDPDQMYAANVWLIKDLVVRAVLNHDPLGKIPYSTASFEKIPGRFWGMGVPDLIRDCQDVANAAARALVNNMAMASGPQVVVNVERLPEGQKLTTLHPWKIWPMVSDPIGSTAPPVDFFVPPSVAGELMSVFEKYSQLADEYSGIPRYLMGDSLPGGVGRTASGLSVFINNASKPLKAVLNNVGGMVEDLLVRLHTHLIYHVKDPAISGDIRIIASGPEAIMQREALALRRNEFLATTANPIDMQIVGLPGRAYLLAEQAKSLGMDESRVVKDPEVLAAQEKMMQGQQALMAQGQPPPAPGEEAPVMDPSLVTEGGRPAAATFDSPATGG